MEQGETVRRTVLGDDHVDTSRPEFCQPFYDHVTAAVWGQVWDRPGLDLRTRSLLTLAILTALRCEHELAMHVRAAVRLGVTPAEIQEVLLHATAYAGAPAGNAAFNVAAQILSELDAEQ